MMADPVLLPVFEERFILPSIVLYSGLLHPQWSQNEPKIKKKIKKGRC
jgi:hypothetical protein